MRDQLFRTLKYYSLKSSHDRKRDIPLFPKGEEIRKAKEKLLGISDTNTSLSSNPDQLDFACWREGEIYDLTSDGSTPDNYDHINARMDIPLQVGWDSDDDNEDGEDTVSARRQNENNITMFGIFRNGL